MKDERHDTTTTRTATPAVTGPASVTAWSVEQKRALLETLAERAEYVDQMALHMLAVGAVRQATKPGLPVVRPATEMVQ